MTDADFMRLAIESARAALDSGQSPFGAVIARDGQVLAASHNEVWEQVDPTAHAEVTAIRLACKKLGKVKLDGCTIYSTTEPCPMCFSAIHWACLGQVIFGTFIADVAKRGFNELFIPSRKMKREGKSPVRIKSGFMKKECLELLKAWDKQDNKKTY